jgi:hypothetical protein
MRKPDTKDGKKTAAKKKKRDPIPDHFETIEAAADFWDTHSLTDYLDEFREVKDVEIELNSRHFRLEDELAKKIGKLARQRGVSSETLVNLWLQQKLSETLKRDKRRQRVSSKQAPTYPKSHSKRTIGVSQYA